MWYEVFYCWRWAHFWVIPSEESLLSQAMASTVSWEWNCALDIWNGWWVDHLEGSNQSVRKRSKVMVFQNRRWMENTFHPLISLQSAVQSPQHTRRTSLTSTCSLLLWGMAKCTESTPLRKTEHWPTWLARNPNSIKRSQLLQFSKSTKRIVQRPTTLFAFSMTEAYRP